MFYNTTQTLGWSEYIDSIVKKAYKNLGLLMKLRFSVDILSQVYISFIRPQAEYASLGAQKQT